MNIIEIIDKKRRGLYLTEEEIKYTIEAFVKEEIQDYQMSALLMAICLNGMSDEEIFTLTESMLNSGDKIDLKEIQGIKVDKHSTGGIGDKTTVILLPLVASTGVIVPKMSGRSLGYTGGTIDKWESIPNFRTDLSFPKFIEQIKSIKVGNISQMGNLVPADKKIYALRDVTATIESIPLIASSVMSKKLASGADKIVIDLKVGTGALIKNIEDAKKLGNLMVKIGKNSKKETACLITDMNQPLGNAVGNALEIIEAIDTLQGHGPKDITEIVLYLGAMMVSLGKNIEFDDAYQEVTENLKNGKAYQKFLELVSIQEGDLSKLKVSDKIISIKSKETGFVTNIHAEKLGEIVRKMGGGRYIKEDKIDHSVGLVLSKKLGDYVLQDEEIIKVYISDKDININEILECFTIEETIKNIPPLIYGMIK